MSNGPQMIQPIIERFPDPVSPRVERALQVLQFMDYKQRPMGFSGNDELEIRDPKPMTEAESALRSAAARTLTRYFQGQLEPDLWDKVLIEQIQGFDGDGPDEPVQLAAVTPLGSEPHGRRQGRPDEPPPAPPVVVSNPNVPPAPAPFIDFACGICNGTPGNANCPQCHGDGRLAVFRRTAFR